MSSREQWSSRQGFILATIGPDVGQSRYDVNQCRDRLRPL